MEPRNQINDRNINEDPSLTWVMENVIDQLHSHHNIVVETIDYRETSNKITMTLNKSKKLSGTIRLIIYKDSFTIHVDYGLAVYEVNPKSIEFYKDKTTGACRMASDIVGIIECFGLSFSKYASPVVMSLFKLPNVVFNHRIK